MSLWQRFVKLTDGDMETAAFGLLLGAFTLVASVGVIVYFASTGRLLVAAVTALLCALPSVFASAIIAGIVGASFLDWW